MHAPKIRKYLPSLHLDLASIYSRNLHKWLLIAPIIGVTTGLAITAIAEIILRVLWPAVLGCFLRHHWTIVPGVTLGFVATGLIMQYLTPDPNEHSTEEIIRSYHDHGGAINMRPFFAKLLAAVTTVGFGGSAALEGPSIYGGGAIGSWLWTKMRRFNLQPGDRRVMLISGAAAGMAAVFRAPLTGLVFALEMPYKDDLAHEALLPSLIASVVSYTTLAFFLGAAPLFNFVSSTAFTGKDLLWSALLGGIIGLAATLFATAFRRAREFAVKCAVPHWMKLTVGGALTGVCGLVFLLLYKGSLVPLGPNYEAVGAILEARNPPSELLAFGLLKLCATIFSLASGGVSAMFVPLFLTGGALGTAFAQLAVRTPALELYAAVGMAAFIAAGYKTPLAAVVFVAEATGGHAFIIPALIGSAVAYGISGDASVSGDQHLHEGARDPEPGDLQVGEIMRPPALCLPRNLSLREFADLLTAYPHEGEFPVVADGRIVGVVSPSSLSTIPEEKWSDTAIADVADPTVPLVAVDCDAIDALHLLDDRARNAMVVTSTNGQLAGVVSKADILSALEGRGNFQPATAQGRRPPAPAASSGKRG